MKDNHITMCNQLLYYLVAPALLLYFIIIDTGFISPSFTVLAIFGVSIILGIGIPMRYKKNNAEYKFNISSKYANAMAILVIFELAYNFYK